MGFRAVGTNDGSYVAIGGQNASTMALEDPTKEYVNIYIDGTAQGVTAVASVQVRYLLDSLKAEGFIKGYTLPDPPPVSLSQVERVAKALMEASEYEYYSDEEFRREPDYEDYIATAKELLEGDNK
jgi:hypothetical protein